LIEVCVRNFQMGYSTGRVVRHYSFQMRHDGFEKT